VHLRSLDVALGIAAHRLERPLPVRRYPFRVITDATAQVQRVEGRGADAALPRGEAVGDAAG